MYIQFGTIRYIEVLKNKKKILDCGNIKNLINIQNNYDESVIDCVIDNVLTPHDSVINVNLSLLIFNINISKLEYYNFINQKVKQKILNEFNI